MAAPRAQVRCALGERLVDVEVRGRSSAAVTVLAVEGDDDRRDAKARPPDGPPRSRRPRDARPRSRRPRPPQAPLRRARRPVRAPPRSRVPRGSSAPRSAPRRPRASARPPSGLRAQETKREVGHPEPPRRVEPGRKAKRHIARGELRGLRDLGGLRSARAPASLLGEPIVFRPARTRRRLSPVSGARSAIVPIATRSSQARRSSLAPISERSAAPSENAKPALHRPLYANPHSGRCGLRNANAGSGFFGHEVVVDHDDVDPAGVASAIAFVIARAAVAGHQQPGSSRRQRSRPSSLRPYPP